MIIKSSISDVNESVQKLKDAETYFAINKLCPSGEETTLTANLNCKTAYEQSQNTIAAFGRNVDSEANNIRSIGETFKEYDSMLSNLWEDGYRYPIISAGE